MAHAQDSLWEYYQNETPAVFDENTGRLAYITRHIPPRARVLNVGVGNGTFERLARARGLEVFALDPSEEAIARLRRTLDLGDAARVGRCEALPFDAAFFDAVVMSEVLEHLDDGTLTAAVAEVVRVLRPGGLFLGSVPSRENLAQHNVICPHCAAVFHRWGHRQTFTPARIAAVVAPLDPVKVIERKFITWSRRKGLARLTAVARVLAPLFGVRLGDESIFFIARKASAPARQA